MPIDTTTHNEKNFPPRPVVEPRREWLKLNDGVVVKYCGQEIVCFVESVSGGAPGLSPPMQEVEICSPQSFMSGRFRARARQSASGPDSTIVRFLEYEYS